MNSLDFFLNYRVMKYPDELKSKTVSRENLVKIGDFFLTPLRILKGYEISIGGNHQTGYSRYETVGSLKKKNSVKMRHKVIAVILVATLIIPLLGILFKGIAHRDPLIMKRHRILVRSIDHVVLGSQTNPLTMENLKNLFYVNEEILKSSPKMPCRALILFLEPSIKLDIKKYLRIKNFCNEKLILVGGTLHDESPISKNKRGIHNKHIDQQSAILPQHLLSSVEEALHEPFKEFKVYRVKLPS